ncbi:MAG TPA: hypothetical protein VGM64_06625 [Lacunisphaera sp.]|jgi:hypothetical protein
MPKATRKGTTSTPFPFARQFTAPPFFVGLEDAKLKGKLLLEAVQRTRKTAVAPPAKKQVAPARKRAKTGKRK